MSLLRPIIRTCAVGALRDRTWAEERVYDSDQTPLAEAVLGEAAKPYIVVYTDTDDHKPAGMGEMYSGLSRTLSLCLEIGVASAIRKANGNIVLQFAATDEGMEWAVDIIESQAIAALFGDPMSPWGDLMKQLVTNVVNMPSRRGGQSQTGVRYAARRTVFACKTISDIPPGVVLAPAHPVRTFIKMARATPSLGVVDVATIIENLLQTTEAPAWRVAQAYLNIGTQPALNINVDGAPLPWGKDKVEVPVETPPLDEATLADYPPLMTDIKVTNDDPVDMDRPPFSNQ